MGVCLTLPETLTLFQKKICDFPYPISDLIKKLVPYFRPEALEPGAWPERVTSCYGTYKVGVNIKRKMVLSPNDEEVASPKKTYPIHIPYFRPKRFKNHTLWTPNISIQPIHIREYPPGRKTRCRLWISLLTHARVIKDNQVLCHLTVKPKVNVCCRLNFRQSRVPKDHLTRSLGNKFIESDSTTSTLSSEWRRHWINRIPREGGLGIVLALRIELMTNWFM